MLETLEQHPWASALVGALLAVFAAIAVHRVGRMVLARVTRHNPMLQSVLRAMDRPASAVLPLAALLLVWQFVPDDLRFIQGLRHANGLALIAAVTWLAIAALGGLSNAVIAQHPVDVADNLQARSVHTQARVLARSDSSETTLFYSNIIGAVAMLPIVPFVWSAPQNALVVALMVLIGALGSGGHYLLIRGHRLAPASTLAPFIYTQMIWTTTLGFLVFGDVPHYWTIVGGSIVIASGLYLLHRETVRGKTEPSAPVA